MKKLHYFFKQISPFLKRNKEMILTVIVVSIGADIFFLGKSLDIVIFIILFCYVVALSVYKLKSSFTLFLCLGLISIMSIEYVVTQISISTEKAAVWFILFLAIGTIQKFRE